MEALFSAINTHTANLLKSEIEYWEERADDDESDKVEIYISKCKDMLEKTDQCGQSSKKCVLRIGHGSGWRFITGAWSERCSNFQSDIINAARPKNFRYTEYDFPKTRHVSEGCDLLGFVRLTMK